MLPLDSVTGAKEVFVRAAEAGERVRLFQSLIKLGVGVPAVEDHFKKHANACRVTNKDRKAKLINLSMRDKLEDAITYNCQMRTKKRKVERRIIRKLGEGVGGEVVGELDKVAEALRQILFDKNVKKEKHLREKFLPKMKSTSENLERYKDAKIFTEDDSNLKSSYNPEKPLVYGNVVLDEDEKAAISMDPKFAVFEDLKVEDFETNTEICMVKLKYLAMDKSDEEA